MRLVLDPGHGGQDPGAIGNGLQEKDLTLLLTQKVAKFLGQYPVEIVFTRASDVTVSLGERCWIANEKKADFFVSLHINAGGGTGYESYVLPGATIGTMEKQKTIDRAVMAFLTGEGVPYRGAKQANFRVLRDTAMPAVLLENLFIDNPRDAVLLKSETFLQDLAGAIAEGIARATGLQKQTPTGEDTLFPEARKWVIDNGISDGTRPKDGLTREEAWEMLRRYHERSVLNGNRDH